MSILFALYKDSPSVTAIRSTVAIYAEKTIKCAAISCLKSGGGDIYTIMYCVAWGGWERSLHVIAGSTIAWFKKKVYVSFFKKLNESNTNDKIMVKISSSLWP